MIFIDLKYIGLLSNNLRNFKKKQNNLWNFSCPICGDSKNKSSKARGYLYVKSNKLFYKCFNCEVSISFSNFLKQINMNLFNEYCVDKYLIKKGPEKEKIIPPPNIPVFEKIDSILSNIPKINELNSGHIAKEYCISRKIPEEKFQLLYYVKNFKEWTNSIIPNKFPSIKNDEEKRLIIPFFNKQKKLIGYSGRSLDKNSNIRYYSIRIIQDEKMLFGIDRINLKEKVYIVEGPIDSLFLKNSVAASNSCLNNTGISKENSVLIPDNSPRNKEVCKLINKYIVNGHNVCLWDKRIRQKDINEMVLAGIDDIESVINENTYSGLKAKLMFNDWREC